MYLFLLKMVIYIYMCVCILCINLCRTIDGWLICVLKSYPKSNTLILILNMLLKI